MHETAPEPPPSHQNVILARLHEFCRFQGSVLHFEKDPWEYMRRKLLEIEAPLFAYKSALLEHVRTRMVRELRNEKINPARCVEIKARLDRLLSPGDFADAAIHLSENDMSPARLKNALSILKSVRPWNPFHEERLQPQDRSPAWEKLVMEHYDRLGFDLLSRIMKRVPRPKRRTRSALRKVRVRVADFCAVIKVPENPGEDITPFMLSRIEALIAASLRFLNKHR